MSAYVTLDVTEISQNITANTSQVVITFSVTSSGATYNEMGDTSGYLTLDGKRIADLAGKRFPKNTTTTLYSGQHTVAHQGDGSKTIAVEAGFDLNTTSYGWLYADRQLVLTTIPRASSVAAGSFTIGAPATIRINRACSGFRHVLRYSIGTAAGAITNGQTDGESVAWTPPESLASQLPDTISREIDILCQTYSGGNLVGTTHNRMTLHVPSSYVPAIQSVTLEPVNSHPWLAGQGIYVERYTRCRVRTAATAGRGSSIGNITITGIGTGHGGDWTSDVLSGGEKTVSVRVDDRRPGRRTTASRVLSVFPYAAPRISSARVVRCDADGKSQEDGTYLYVCSTVEVTSLGGRNSATIKMRTRPSSGRWGGFTELASGVGKIIPGFSAQQSYEVEITAVDCLGEKKTAVCLVPTAEVALHLRPGGKGVGIGKYSEKEALECALPAEFPAGMSVKGVSAGLLAYPVGAIYLSVSNTDPGKLFGGVWQRIQDRFLLGAGAVYAAGSTGGEAEHRLTIDEMPRHFHGIGERNNEGSYGPHYALMTEYGTYNWAAGNAKNEGGDRAHNNMPPYLVVYMWKRIG